MTAITAASEVSVTATDGAMATQVVECFTIVRSMGKKSEAFGGDDYRLGALERIQEALTLVRNLGLLRPGDRRLETDVQKVARLWFNNMRFTSSKFVERHWRRNGEVHRRRTMKRASIEFFDACSAIIKRCEALYGGTKQNQASADTD